MPSLRSIPALFKPLVKKFPALTCFYRSLRDQLDARGEALQTPWGFKLAGNPLMAKGEFEPEETALVRSLLKDAEVVVNVGANVGYYCCHALSLGKRVIAFEPMPRNLHYLCRNIKQNGWTEIEIFPLALSDKPGILEIYGGNTGASLVKGWCGIPEDYVTLVPSSTMDLVLGGRLAGKKVLFVVDIEGAEKWMLQGAAAMLANTPKPVWLVEITAAANQPEGVKLNQNFRDTFKLFFDQGYRAFTADAKQRQVSAADVEAMAAGKLEIPAYNFIFKE